MNWVRAPAGLFHCPLSGALSLRMRLHYNYTQSRPRSNANHVNIYTCHGNLYISMSVQILFTSTRSVYLSIFVLIFQLSTRISSHIQCQVFMICAMVTAFIGGGLVLGFERLTKKAYLSLYNNGHCRLVTTIATPALIFFIFFSFAVLSMLPDVGDSTVTESASVSKLLKTTGANASVGSTLDFHSASNVLSYYSPKALVNRAVYTVLAAIYDAPTDDGTLSDITSIDGDASVDVSATTATVGGDLVSTTTDGITNTLDAASEGGSPSSFSLLALGEELVNDSFTHTSLVDKKSFGFSMLILSLITLMYALLFRIWFHQFRKAKIELDYVMNPDEGKHLRADESSVQQGGRHREGGSDRYRRVKRRYEHVPEYQHTKHECICIYLYLCLNTDEDMWKHVYFCICARVCPRILFIYTDTHTHTCVYICQPPCNRRYIRPFYLPMWSHCIHS